MHARVQRMIMRCRSRLALPFRLGWQQFVLTPCRTRHGPGVEGHSDPHQDCRADAGSVKGRPKTEVRRDRREHDLKRGGNRLQHGVEMLEEEAGHEPHAGHDADDREHGRREDRRHVRREGLTQPVLRQQEDAIHATDWKYI